MHVEIYNEYKNISDKQIELVKSILEFAAEYIDLEDNAEVSVTLVDNQRIQEINREYRDKDYATDVISFAVRETLDDELDVFQGLEDIDFPVEIGDLFISIDKLKEQAGDYGHSTDRELAFLTVHGFLHLNGYDHMTDADEKEMFGLQEEILKEFGLER